MGPIAIRLRFGRIMGPCLRRSMESSAVMTLIASLTAFVSAPRVLLRCSHCSSKSMQVSFRFRKNSTSSKEKPGKYGNNQIWGLGLLLQITTKHKNIQKHAQIIQTYLSTVSNACQHACYYVIGHLPFCHVASTEKLARRLSVNAK